jgi:hypothetical protein
MLFLSLDWIGFHLIASHCSQRACDANALLSSQFANSLLYSIPLMTPSFIPPLLLGASLLGASGLALTAGGAKAMTFCTFGNAQTDTCVYGATATLGDKKITHLYGPNTGSGDVEFTNPPVTPDVYSVDTDFAGELADPTLSYFAYKLEITHPTNTFKEARLRWLDGAGAPVSTVTKYIYDDPGYNDLIGSTDTNNGTINLTGKRTIYVLDSYASGGALDFIRNDYTQVPAPLPLLGAGAVFGACRRLRRLSDRLPRRSAAGSPLA